jgi:hypothetical protein
MTAQDFLCTRPKRIVQFDTHEKKYDVIKEMRNYDQGKLDEAQTIRLFQKLIDSEIVWMLQANYGRVAKSLMKEGKCRKAHRNALD